MDKFCFDCHELLQKSSSAIIHEKMEKKKIAHRNLKKSVEYS